MTQHSKPISENERVTDEVHPEHQENTEAAQYNPKQLTEPGADHTKGNDVILVAYNNPSVQPTTPTHGFIRIGTGGHSPWERYWHKDVLNRPGYDVVKAASKVDKNLDHPGPTRAMHFASDIAQQYGGGDQHSQDAFSQTEAAKQMTREHDVTFRKFLVNLHNDNPDNEQIDTDEGAEQLLQKFRDNHPEPETPMSRYVERHPSDWQARYKTIETFCRDAFETGQHITYQGILQGDEIAIAIGRRVMERSSNMADELVLDDTPTDHLITKIGTQGPPNWYMVKEQAEKDAQQSLEYIRETTAVFFETTEEINDSAMDFMAHTIVSHQRLAIADQNISRLHDLGAKDGGIATAMRSMSDKMFKEGNSLTNQAVAALVEQNDQAMRSTYQAMTKTQLAMVSAAYTFDQTATEDEQAEQIHHIAHQENELPEPDPQLDYLRQKIVDTVQEMRQSQHSYNHRKADIIENLARPGRLEECVRVAQAHPQWQPFLRGEITFRPYG